MNKANNSEQTFPPPLNSSSPNLMKNLSAFFPFGFTSPTDRSGSTFNLPASLLLVINYILVVHFLTLPNTIVMKNPKNSGESSFSRLSLSIHLKEVSSFKVTGICIGLPSLYKYIHLLQ